jgi:hypothetical protein
VRSEVSFPRGFSALSRTLGWLGAPCAVAHSVGIRGPALFSILVLTVGMDGMCPAPLLCASWVGYQARSTQFRSALYELKWTVIVAR